LRLQLANEYDTININAYEYPLPDPNACTIVPSVAVIGNTYALDISPVAGDYPVVFQGVNWGTNGGTKYQPKIWNVNGQPDDTNGLVTGQTYRVEITLSVAMSGSFYFSFGRFANAPSYNGWDWVLNGALTTTQVNDLVWNPYNLSGGTGIYGILGKAGLTFPGYNGTITINVYSGTCP
jgi:hypothetical protein